MFRRNPWAITAGGVVFLLLTLTLARSGVAWRVSGEGSDVAAEPDGGADAEGTILVGTGRQILEGVDYVAFQPPRAAIGLNYDGNVQFRKYHEGTYPNAVLNLDVFSSLGVVNEDFALEWVFSGVAEYYF